MNIHELDSYNLGDAVKFHRRLNPRLWGRDEHLLPEVREKLLAIAADFQEFLGVEDLNVKDITISGSNAAYSYTKNSDIDLHLVVEMPADPVYQELFNAKKYQYNDEHNIKIGGADVELYVQPADQPHISQGIYSVQHNNWISVPQRQRAQVDDACVRDKVSDLDARIHAAVKSKNIDAISTLWAKIKTMRQAGLEQHGEFGCENISFKLLRNKGCIRLLKDAMTAEKDRELSLRETPARPFRYGYGAEVEEASLADMRSAFAATDATRKQEVFHSPDEYNKVMKQRQAAADQRQEKIAKISRGPTKPWPMGVKEGHQGQPYSSEDGVAASTCMFLNEGDDENLVHEFIQHTAMELGIDPLPEIQLHTDPEWSTHNHSFGRYDPDSHTLNVSMPNRHILDVLRTVAHELVHCSQNQQHDGLPDDAGETGSRWENDANARAGIIMRDWANTHPEHFEMPALGEGASGYIPKNKREAAMPQYAMALSVDIKPGQTGKEANKLALQTGRNGEPGLLMKTVNLRESVNNYLWHGSKSKHDILYPQQANDTGGKKESNKNAVYATPRAKVAISMGLTTPGSDTGMFPNDPQMVLFKGGIRKGQMVYLHKVPKDLFIKHNDREWFSKPGVTEVKPIEVVTVPVDKYLHLIRQATPQDLELQKKYMQKQNVKEYAMPQPSQGPGRYRELNEPLGPETPPKMPDGTIKVDVSDMYDWYKLGQKISDLGSIKPGELGSGPPSTVFAFGSEDLENMYSHALTRLGLKTHDLDEPGEEDIDESAGDYQIRNTEKLDRVLARCCQMIEHGQQTDPERYGMVAACVIDPDNRQVYGINLPSDHSTRRHAERVAINKYQRQHGDIPEGSIVVTTLSPCNAPMDERAGESCKDLLNSAGIHKVYCGYIDPTQHDDDDADFTIGVTQNDELWASCKAFADTFLHEDELEEGWKSALAGAGAAAAMAFTPAPANSTAAPTVNPAAQPAAVQQTPGSAAESALTRAAKAAGINGVELAQFLAQCAHESGDFSHMEELGGNKYLAKYDPTVNPAKAKALGNTQAGDGAKYKGRGFIQITGKANYATAGQALGIDLVSNPEAAARPDIAAKIAVWYWQNRVAPYVQNFSDTRGVTKRINPGLQGLQDRESNFKDYQQQAAASAPPTARVAAAAPTGAAV